MSALWPWCASSPIVSEFTAWSPDEILKLLGPADQGIPPRCVAIQHESDVPRLRKLLGRTKVEIFCGEAGASAVATATEVDVVLAAIVGGAGLMPTLQGVLAGKEIALANKEALVMAGEILRRMRQRQKEFVYCR